MILAIDQGTTGTTCLLFDARGPDRRPRLLGVRAALPAAGLGRARRRRDLGRDAAGRRRGDRRRRHRGRQLDGIGIANQRETVVAWDPASGEPLHRALVWQDRRTAERCEELRAAGHEQLVRERTGLVLDPYFSGTKIEWLARNVEGAERAVFGTIDSWLALQAHRPPRDRLHERLADDALRHPPARRWDEELCELLGVDPRAPAGAAARPPASTGRRPSSAARSPWRGSRATSRRRSSARPASSRASAKNTYGTGSFVLLNTGDRAPEPAPAC